MRVIGRGSIHRSAVQLIMLGACFLLCLNFVSAQEPFGDAKKDGRDDNNKIRIRNILLGEKSLAQPLIEIELYSDRKFPALNSAVVLLVGDQVFHGGGLEDEGHRLIFRVKPEEFAKTRNGERVIVTYQGNESDKVHEENSDDSKEQPRLWRFGKLDKSKIDQQEPVPILAMTG